MQFFHKKNKINLLEYPYKKDIESRLFLSQLSVFEVQVLCEIMHHSLRISIESLAADMHVELDQLKPAIEKLAVSKLFKQEKNFLIVDRELRKYYTSQLEMFEEGFEPGLEFLQDMLSKVPMQVLPNWYAIPRSSDHIFTSIIERYLLTPEIYRQYLSEVQFDDPLISELIQELYQAPDYKLPSSHFKTKFQLTSEQFAEYMLLLEYHLICCVRYEKKEDQFIEMVTPFQEWLDYLIAENKSKSTPILDAQLVQTTAPEFAFAFIKDMQTVLQAIKHENLRKKAAESILARSMPYQEHLKAKLLQIGFCKHNESGWHITAKGEEWLTKSPSEQSTALSVDRANQLLSDSSDLFSARNLRLVEKNLLGRLIPNQWVDLEEFLSGFLAPIGNREPILLKNKGKKWKYQLPTYNAEEIAFVRALIWERFFELGYVATGFYNEKRCFALTSFGRMVFS